MADRTAIEWTDATWNPIRARNRETGKVGWFCVHASPGCAHCYAEPINRRLGTGVDYKAQNIGEVEVFIDEAMLAKPLRWKRPRRIFVGSMTDLFGDFVTDAMIDQVFAVMALSPRHTFQVLTKRPGRMRAYATDPSTPGRVWMAIAENHLHLKLQALAAAGARWGGDTPWPLPNVWLGVSAEDQTRADERIPVLLDTPAAKRFVSLEPLLGPIDLRADTMVPPANSTFGGYDWMDVLNGRLTVHDEDNNVLAGSPHGPRLDWVIVGGESGPGARPMHPDWARRIRDDCAAAGVPFFFKQWGAFIPWEPEGDGVCWRSQDGRLRDRHGLGDVDDPRSGWSDHCLYDGDDICVHERVAKRAAGRVLDGVTHDGFPEIRA